MIQQWKVFQIHAPGKCFISSILSKFWWYAFHWQHTPPSSPQQRIFPLIFITPIRQIFCLSPFLLMRIWCQFFPSWIPFDWQFSRPVPLLFPSGASRPIGNICTHRMRVERFSWAFRAGAPSPLACLPLTRLFFLAPTTSKHLLRRLHCCL